MRKLTYIVFFVLVCMFSCKTKTDIVNPDVELVITTTVNGKTQSGVRILLFSRLLAYDSAIVSNSAKHAVDSGITASNGTITFDKLSSTTKYWILATWTDTTAQISYNNLNGNYVLANNLNAGSITYATINLGSSNSYVGFYAKSSVNLPVHVVITDNSTGDTTKTILRSHLLTALPTALDTLHYKRLNLDPGQYTYYAYDSAKSFYNIDTFSVVKGQTTFVQIIPASANVGQLSFYFNDSENEYATDLYPITVILDQGDTVGSIKGATSSYICGNVPGANVISIWRPLGNHTYKAYSKNGLYKWQNGFTSTGCEVIPLD